MNRKITTWLMASVCGCALVGALAAQEPQPYRLTTRSIPERGQVGAVEFSIGQAKASIILPNGWRLGQGNEGLVLQTADFSATLVLKACKLSEANTEAVKNNLEGQAERVVFGSDYAWTTGVGEATAVDAQLGENGELKVQTSTFIIKFAKDALVVTLTTSPQGASKTQTAVANILASLRLE